MKEEKIKKLFEKYHSTCYDAMEARHVKVLLPDDLTRTVKQVEKELKLEWYKELFLRLEMIVDDDSTIYELVYYRDEIQNKIKELERIRIAKEEKMEGIKTWKAGLLLRGYDFIKVYEFVKYNYDLRFDESTGRTKYYKQFNSKDENVYCPKQKENGKNKRIELSDCVDCEFHFRITFEEPSIKNVVCGFRNNLKTI